MRWDFSAPAIRRCRSGRVFVAVGAITGIWMSTTGAGIVGARPADSGGAFARGVRAFRAGDYVEAEKALRKVPAKSDDWATYLQAESAFYAGSISVARDDFERLAAMKRSRLSDIAAFRAADCMWSSGSHADAAQRYGRLLTQSHGHPPSGIDAAVPRYRVALDAEERHRPEAARLFLALYRDLPAHPLATEARRHLPPAPAPDTHGQPAMSGTASDQLHRAENLTRERHWAEALDELSKLPADLPAPLAVERDFQIGMTKFHMRRDYGKAAELLLAIVPALSGEKAASALFHGTRSLSRVDRDDEAIAGYKQVVSRFPTSKFAAEAQFLSGWLDYNRGRYRESLPGLLATLDRFGTSAFADDAAWCVAFAHFLLGEMPQASAGLDRYARMPLTGMTTDERASRVAYWRARIDAKAQRLDEAKVRYREVNRRWPFSFFGVAARARLVEWGEAAAVDLPRNGNGVSAAAPPTSHKKAALDPTIVRANDLAAAGLDVEAGWELQRDEKGIWHRLGEQIGTRALLDRYPAFKAFRRAYELAEGRNGGALALLPEGEALSWWQASYPRAYRDLVERYGPPAGNPDLFLYAIMRKESGFSPWDVSTADARGLLQMIPPTSAQVAAAARIDFSPDELFDPETNIRLGAAYIGALAKKFAGQIPVVAGGLQRWPKSHGEMVRSTRQPSDGRIR